MDVLLQRRISAHTRSAIDHANSADFHHAVSEFFETLGDETYAKRARDLELQHRVHALHDWELAPLSGDRDQGLSAVASLDTEIQHATDRHDRSG